MSCHLTPLYNVRSGRVWKTEVSDPVRATAKSKSAHSSWAEKEALRAEKNRVKELERARKQEMQDALDRKRAAREEKQRRTLLNARKSEQVVALNPKKLRQKLKTMSKKQLRNIRKEGVAPL